MIDLARQRVPLGPDDVLRISLDPARASGGERREGGRDGREGASENGDGMGGPPVPSTGGEGRLALPGTRRLI